MTPIEQLQEKVASLQSALLAQHPAMPGMLREIHTQLKADAELVTLLSEEEIGTIVSGLMRQTQTQIVTGTAAKAAATKKLKSGITLDDI